MKKFFATVLTVVLLICLALNTKVFAVSDTYSFMYTDADSGVSFTVPNNWQQKEFSKDREFIDAKFVSTTVAGCTIIYGSTDMWSQMSASEQMGYTRSDLSNSAFTKSDIAEMYGTTVDNITIVTYNGIQYFKGEINYTSDTYGIDITIAMTQLVYIDNGWMYVFQFGGTGSHELYSDFESLLQSVQYPTVSNAGNIGYSSNTNFEYTDNSTDSLGVIAIVMLLAVVAIIIVAVIASRKKSNEQETTTNSTLIYDTPKPEPQRETEPIVYCRKCGQKLPLDSSFCHNCGTEVVKE